MIELQLFFYKLLIWWVVSNKEKCDVSSWPKCETVRMCTWTICNNIIDKFVIIVLLLKDSMILLRRQILIL